MVVGALTRQGLTWKLLDGWLKGRALFSLGNRMKAIAACMGMRPIAIC
jgi:hypothetical protein